MACYVALILLYVLIMFRAMELKSVHFNAALKWQEQFQSRFHCI